MAQINRLVNSMHHRIQMTDINGGHTGTRHDIRKFQWLTLSNLFVANSDKSTLTFFKRPYV